MNIKNIAQKFWAKNDKVKNMAEDTSNAQDREIKQAVNPAQGRFGFQLPETASDEERKAFDEKVELARKNNTNLIVDPSVKIIDLDKVGQAPAETTTEPTKPTEETAPVEPVQPVQQGAQQPQQWQPGPQNTVVQPQGFVPTQGQVPQYVPVQGQQFVPGTGQPQRYDPQALPRTNEYAQNPQGYVAPQQPQYNPQPLYGPVQAGAPSGQIPVNPVPQVQGGNATPSHTPTPWSSNQSYEEQARQQHQQQQQRQ